MKTICKSTIRAARHSFVGVVCAGAVLLIASSTQAQNLFVSDMASGNIYEFTPSGVQTTFATGLGYPAGLAFNSAGDLFEADMHSGNIYEFTPGGVQSTFASGLQGPTGLAFDSAGNLYAACEYNIFKITPGGVQSTFASGLTSAGLAFNSAGNLFASELGTGNIYEYTSGGVRSTFFVQGTPGGFDPVVGMAFNNAGNLFATGFAFGKIDEYTTDGTQSTFTSAVNGPWGLAFQPVPEPSALGLLAVGVTALLVRRCRRATATLR